MSKRNHSPEPSLDSLALRKDEEMSSSGIVSWRWKRTRNFSPAALMLESRGRFVHPTTSEDFDAPDRHKEDEGQIICFPLFDGYSGILTLSFQHGKLPSPFKVRGGSMRVHSFAFQQQVAWTPDSQLQAKVSLEQQLRTQVDADPHIYFPSSPSVYLDVTFSGIKQYAEGHKIQLEWNSQSLAHVDVGTFLPDDHIVIGVRGIASTSNLVSLLLAVQSQLRKTLSLKSVDFLTTRFGRDFRRSVVILAAFKNTGYHSGMLPGWIRFEGENFKLYFEDRDDVCEVCRLENHDWYLPGVSYPEAVCTYCKQFTHCEFTHAHPDIEPCCVQPRMQDIADGGSSF